MKLALFLLGIFLLVALSSAVAVREDDEDFEQKQAKETPPERDNNDADVAIIYVSTGNRK